MSPLLADLISLALVGAWYRWRPRETLAATFRLWGLGIALARVAPPLLRWLLATPEGTISGTGEAIAEIVPWIGSLLLLRAILLLGLWDRPRSRRLAVWMALFTAALLLGSLGTRGLPFSLILSLPFLLSARWSAALDNRGLALVSLGALVSALLCGIDWSTASVEVILLPGLVTFEALVRIIALVYAIVAFVRSTRQTQVSIRRIGPRLVVSHLLAGLAPLVLMSLFLLLASALFLSTYRGTLARRYLTRTAVRASEQLAAGVHARPFGVGVGGQIVILRAGEDPAQVTGGPFALSADSLLLFDASPEEVPLLWDGERLFLRARASSGGIPGSATRGSESEPGLVVQALAPVDSIAMVELSELIGIPVRVNPRLQVVRREARIEIGGDNDIEEEGPAIGPPTLPGQVPGGAVIRCLAAGPRGWEVRAITLLSSAPLGEPLLALLTTARENPLATAVLIVLGVLAFLLLAGLWLTANAVIGMGRSIAGAVGALRGATQALGRGELGHRIRLEGDDELWSVAASFNQMAEGLARVRAIERERQRLEEELRLAREIQERLLPVAPPLLRGLDLAGVSLPAQQVGGDYFDYLQIGPERVGLVIADVSGKGVPAALLMSGFRASLRSEDLARLGPGGAMTRLNRFVHASVEPGKFITVFLAVIDGDTGEMRYANAGHEPALILPAEGPPRALAEGGPILGLLPEVPYGEARTCLEPGSLLTLFTDGVTEAQSPAEEFFGSERLGALLAQHRRQSCQLLVDDIVAAVRSFASPAPQHDDITLILARRL